MSPTAARKTTAASTPAAAAPPAPAGDVQQRILDTACQLFYAEGVRAVGIDLIIERAQIAKTSLYRYYRTKDDLVAAFLEREDREFWQQWDEAANTHAPDAAAELDALLAWVGERVARPGYRGCPQLNVAAEFADPAHPARAISAAHRLEQRKRLAALCRRIGLRKPEVTASQLSLLVDGAFSSGSLLLGDSAGKVLRAAGRALVEAAG
ncbi:transcriptional regulator [Acidovorax sp. CF316]|uniref:TetR/AcrR family transcriptional regulator n=1 Tax=Acidovorax sp. CF316 TaxID=1144317 RepID=UPI00026BCFC3|nr:TetR/AcrR family transcriptional regulator [Acidovorax sp. CF316]EJE51714.1 transcriptional regulator [Acidovorax sp. CF316]